MVKKAAKKKRASKDTVKRLYRASEKDSMIGGVCAGIARYFNIDPTLIRLLMVFLAFMSAGTAILAYLVAWIIVPRK